ncbi:putative aldehyde dehydrogenase YcbD [Sulfodiicoccus acidiphilus]|uniref:Putative aldehyde dehydrogenase YcbD n=1 Tax=Sulfodiicoccus acidiphilus TaxID=1670455 RepID=A0A348B4Y9_9CREN|nr:aldehyde dehydrogenase family protein [Sulfodiicoccus acidiphilus]BBD73241.1 putative aldehyde dehydrogenase YcbD [Sulfodiicoccus acidiphilus]GGT89670.1 putative aldehyde dehydrogenase YcbD [Sulfodiicoccus acidiphilus]
MTKTGVFIGKYIVPEDREYYQIRNPADTSELVAEFPLMKREDVGAAVEAARKGFETWSNMLPVQRANVLYRAAEIVQSRFDKMAELLTREEGKTVQDSAFEVTRTVNLLRFYAGLITTKEGKVIPSQDQRTTILTYREPLGVIGVITPWNFPLSLPAWKIVPAIATGNAVVWKPASITPVVATELVRALYEAGLPEGVVNTVVGPGSTVGDEMTSLNQFDAITFTGSLQVGREVAKKVGGRFTRLQLELGGKNATVLSKKGKQDLAVEQVVRAAFGLTGQACTATSRFLVPEDLHDSVLSKLVERTRRLVVGNGLKKGVDVGPLASREQYEKVLSYIDVGKSEGAKLVLGGEPLKGAEHERGYFVQPTIFDGVTSDMRIAREEIFGPVLSVMSYRNMDEALDIVNGTEYGLVAEIVTDDLSEAADFSRAAKVGVVKINKPTTGLEPWVPYGGVKGSGNDVYKEMGEEALDFFTRYKAVYLGY